MSLSSCCPTGTPFSCRSEVGRDETAWKVSYLRLINKILPIQGRRDVRIESSRLICRPILSYQLADSGSTPPLCATLGKYVLHRPQRSPSISCTTIRNVESYRVGLTLKQTLSFGNNDCMVVLGPSSGGASDHSINGRYLPSHKSCQRMRLLRGWPARPLH